jgi:hypothetical protein
MDCVIGSGQVTLHPAAGSPHTVDHADVTAAAVLRTVFGHIAASANWDQGDFNIRVLHGKVADLLRHEHSEKETSNG